MVIARLIKENLSSTPAGGVLTTRDFGVEMRYQPALAKALNRLVLQGELQKIAKGKYYIPKKTIFGNLKPADSELVLATDYVTSPMTHKGMLIYGVCIGLLTVIIRNWGSYPEGMSFAILIMNAFTPLINTYVKPKRFGEKPAKK